MKKKKIEPIDMNSIVERTEIINGRKIYIPKKIPSYTTRKENYSYSSEYGLLPEYIDIIPVKVEE